MSILKCMVEWSKDQYVNPNSQTSLGKTPRPPAVSTRGVWTHARGGGGPNSPALVCVEMGSLFTSA